jgi:hypothetical protein
MILQSGIFNNNSSGNHYMKKTITDLLSHLKIPVSTNYCEQLIAAHPDYPSLLSIVDSLNRLGVPNIAARVQKEQLPDLVFPYVLQLETKHGDLLLIRNARDLDKNRNKLDDWNGIVLHIEPTKTVVDAEHNKVYKREEFFKVILFVAGLSLLIPFVWSAINHFSVVNALIDVSVVAGLIVGYLLIAKDLGIRFDVVETFCISQGYKNDCDTILRSDGASLFGFIKLSDMVFIYFLWQACCLAGLSGAASVSQFFSIASILTVPAVIYSIAYQFNQKAWCKLCLIVDGILVIQFALFSTAIINSSIVVPAPELLMSIIASGVVIGAIVLFFKGRTEDILKLERMAAEAGRVKHSPFVFTNFLKRGEREVEFTGDRHIISGNKKAPLKFVMAGNLYCKPCGDQHKHVENLVEMFPDYLCIEYRFVRAKDADATPNSNQYLIEYWLRNIRSREDEGTLTKKYLLDWYEHRDLDKFRKIYPLADETLSEECVALEKQHVDWFQRQGVINTPTFYLNGYKLPKEWLPLDIATIIPSLVSDAAKLKTHSHAPSVEDVADLA